MSLIDYSDLEQEIKEAPEPKTLAAGTQANARIISVRSGVSEKGEYDGCQWVNVSFDVPSEPMAKEFSDFFWVLDKEKLPIKAFSRELYHSKSFFTAFDIDISRPFSWEDDLPGKTGDLIVGVKKSDEYGEQNTVKKYLAS